MSAYPEHLNPFAEEVKKKKKTVKITAFRDFKNTLRRSFRGKSRTEDEVEIRNKQQAVHLPVGTPQMQRYTLPQPLPRSRFQERLSQSQGRGSYNPFDEDREENETPKPKTRRKKQAPLPPKSASSQDVSTDKEVPTSSQWSLNSEMDSSYVDESDNENTDRHSLKENFSNFAKEMEKLTDDSNNNVVNNKDAIKNIPDVVVSCPESDRITDDDEQEDNSENKENNAEENQQTTIGTNHEEITPDIEDSKPNAEITETATIEEPEEVQEIEVITNGTKNLIAIQEDTSEIGSDDDELVVKDITHNLIPSANSEEPFQYNQKKTIYIAGSLDELNENQSYTGNVSIYVTNSQDQLDACNNNEPAFEKDGLKYADEDEETTPQPKQRKNKLSKNTLLGI